MGSPGKLAKELAHPRIWAEVPKRGVARATALGYTFLFVSPKHPKSRNSDVSAGYPCL